MATKPPKQKIEPILVDSREAMMAHVTDIVQAKHKIVEIKARLAQDIAERERQCQVEIDELTRVIATKEAGVHLFCKQHRRAEFADKKSIELLTAFVGFEFTPPSVEKVRGVTWEEAGERMASLILHQVDEDGALVLNAERKPIVIFDGDKYVNYGAPALDKAAIKRDAETIPKEVFDVVGIRIEKDEIFYIRPKSDVAEATVREAAAA